jgi:hypothetical protein
MPKKYQSNGCVIKNPSTHSRPSIQISQIQKYRKIFKIIRIPKIKHQNKAQSLPETIRPVASPPMSELC